MRVLSFVDANCPQRAAQEHTTSHTPVSSATQQPQKRAAKEVIAANVQALIEQLEQGKSEALTAYFSAMARFHNYSFLRYA